MAEEVRGLVHDAPQLLGFKLLILCTESSFQHRALKSKIDSRDVFFHITLMSQ